MQLKPPAQDVQKAGQYQIFTMQQSAIKRRAPSKKLKEKLIVHTHAEERMCPPIIIMINKRCIPSFHPQKRGTLDSLQEDEDVSCLIMENTIVPVFPYLPSSCVPNTCKIRLCTPG